ncbi:MAG: LuxR C-terminal-related transcriptional regulator [Pseudomonadota bacterium]
MKKQSLLNAYRESQSALRDLAEIAVAADSSTAWSLVEKLCADMGFDYSGTGVVGNRTGEISVGLRYGTPFFEHTFREYEKSELHLADPMAFGLLDGARVLNAEDVLGSPPRRLAEGARRMKDYLKAYSIAGDAALRIDLPGRPYTGYLGVGFKEGQSKTEFRDKLQQNSDVLMVAAAIYTSVALRERNPKDHAPIVTDREKSVLSLLAQGLTPREIAEQECKSLTTIRNQIASARARLGARSSAHAVALAIELKLIRT